MKKNYRKLIVPGKKVATEWNKDKLEERTSDIKNDHISNKEKVQKVQIFKCLYCDSEFSWKQNLVSHIKKLHTEEYPKTDFSKITLTDLKVVTGQDSKPNDVPDRSPDIEILTDIPIRNDSKINKSVQNGAKTFKCLYCERKFPFKQYGIPK